MKIQALFEMVLGEAHTREEHWDYECHYHAREGRADQVEISDFEADRDIRPEFLGEWRRFTRLSGRLAENRR